MLEISIRLTDVGLFGNDAAEDESEDVFRSYIVDRPEVETFADASRPLAIARAYKGEGKSALLRITHLRLEADIDGGGVLMSKPATELMPELGESSYTAWVKGWKAAIFGLLASEIGSRIGVAWSDDAMTLVEEAEANGFRARGFVASITDRLSGGIEAGPVTLRMPDKKRPEVKSIAGAVRRRAQGLPAIWLLVDDLDKNFEDTLLQRTKIASFFDAAREIVRAVPELRIRAAIRPNVWTAIKLQFESLSHVEQYVQDLRWTEDDARRLIAKRVEGYLRRHGQWDRASAALPRSIEEREKTLIGFVFETPMPWGRSTRPPHVLVFTLSKHRPRWIIELCKVAATQAHRAGHTRITHDDLIGNLSEFGDRRIQDTVAEFKSQCGQIEELITAFSRAPEQLTTDELLKLIQNKILTHLEPRISGVVGHPKPLQVAAFLYEIGFFYGRRDNPDGTYQHVTYAERPSLLRSRTDVDAGMIWEIHPVFRQSLEMRDEAGREVRPISRRRGPRR